MKIFRPRIYNSNKAFKKINKFIILLLVTYCLNILLCQAALFSVDADAESSNQLNYIAGPLGSPEKFVSISKDLIHLQDSKSPTENRCVFAEVRFLRLKGEDWRLGNLIINEYIDKELSVEKNSFKCVITNNISEINQYKNDLNSIILKNSTDVVLINKNNFRIIVPKEFDSTYRVVFWYNFTVKKAGKYNLNTIVMSNPKSNIYFDVERSLAVSVDNYDIITDPFFKYLKGFLWIIIIFSGVFTFYKQIIQKEADPKSYHLKDFFKGMYNEIVNLIKELPSIFIVLVFLIMEIVLIYIYISIQYPSDYPSISEYLYKNWVFITGISPMLITFFIPFILLFLKRTPKEHLHEAWLFMDKMPPIICIIFILLYHLVIFALLVIVNDLQS